MGKLISATECAPKKCQCGARLKPHYHKAELNYPKMNWHCRECSEPISGHKDNCWAIKCNQCQRFYEWRFHAKHGAVWQIASGLPLFNSREIVAVQHEASQ